MTKEKYTARTYPAGAAGSGLAYTVKLHEDAGATTLGSGNTDGSGQATYTANLSPGPHYFTVTDTAPTPDAVRVVSSQSTGSGGAYSLAEVPIALRALGTGVIDGYLNEIAVTDPGSGTNIAYDTGAALIKGIPCVVASSGTHAIVTSQDVTNPKACYFLIELTGLGETNEGKAVFKDSCGAAAASPSLPVLTQTEATYQYPLATFQLGIVGASNANDVVSVTDVRTFIPGRNPIVSSIARRTDPTDEDPSTSTTGEDATLLTTTPTLLSGVVYDLHARCFLQCKISSAAETAQVAIYLNGTSNIATYITTNSTGYIGLANAYSLLNQTGAGATINCGVRVKVSGGTMTYAVGMLEVLCVPRS